MFIKPLYKLEYNTPVLSAFCDARIKYFHNLTIIIVESNLL